MQQTALQGVLQRAVSTMNLYLVVLLLYSLLKGNLSFARYLVMKSAII